MYLEGFLERTEVSNYINVALVPFTLFMLISFAFLPSKWTHRNFLSVSLSLAILCMQIAFIIPLGAEPEQCYNGITPNDMHSDLTCAFTGAFILFGGWGVIIWSMFPLGLFNFLTILTDPYYRLFPGSLTTLTRLLGYNHGERIFLLYTNRRVGHSGYWIGTGAHLDRDILSFRKRLPYQSPSGPGRFLGPADGLRCNGFNTSVYDARLLRPCLRQIIDGQRSFHRT